MMIKIENYRMKAIESEITRRAATQKDGIMIRSITGWTIRKQQITIGLTHGLAFSSPEMKITWPLYNPWR